MECLAIGVLDLIARIEREQFHLDPVREICGLVDNEPAGGHASLNRHVVSVPLTRSKHG